MNYLLDTNICIYLMKHQPPEVAKRFARLHVGDVGISTITFAELEHGVGKDPETAPIRRKALQKLAEFIPVLHFDSLAARSYGELRSTGIHLGRHRFDTLIAAHALAEKLILVTNNEKDFIGIPGLTIENWIH